jgi:hypothetical protein
MVVHIDTSKYNRTCPRCRATVHGLNADTCPSCGGSMSPACIGCGYDLAGLAREAACPECGTSVERSYAPDLLENRSEAYLEQVSSGLLLVIVGTLCGLGLILLMIPAVIIVSAMTDSSAAATRVVEFTAGVLRLLCTGTVLFGWWRVTTPDPARFGTDLDVKPRRIVRTAILVQVGGELLGVAAAGLSLLGAVAGHPAMDQLLASTRFVAWVAWAVQYFAAMLYIGWLARRAPDPWLVGYAKHMMWIGPVLFVVGWICLGLGPLAALILYVIALGKLRGHVRGALRRIAAA